MKTFFLVIMLGLLAVPTAPAATITDDFSSGRDDWFASQGDWQVRDGALVQTSRLHLYLGGIVFRRIEFRSGRISFRAKLDEPSPVHIILKYRHHARTVHVEFGRGGKTIYSFVDGEDREARWEGLGEYPIEVGKWITYAVTLEDGLLTAWVNDEKMGSRKVDLSGMEGYVGFQLKRGSIDDVEIEGDFDILPDAREVTGEPKLEYLFSNWHSAPFHPAEYISVKGSLNLYVKNTGTGLARLDDILIAGQTSDLVIDDDWVAYAVLTPPLLRPGETGEIQIRLRGCPEALLGQALAGKDDGVEVPVIVHCRKAEPLNLRARAWGRSSPLQINVLTFSEDLKRVYVYLQNNPMVYQGTGKVLNINKISLNGTDVTGRAIIGSREVGGDVVPVTISLEEPLVKGRYACVTVETEEGRRAGHSLRAFPGRFDVLVRGHDDQPRRDVYEDLAQHGVTHGSNIRHRDTGKNYFPETPINSWQIGPREPAQLNLFLNRDGSSIRYQRTEHIFMDEVDKPDVIPVEIYLRGFTEVEKYYAAAGRYHLRSTVNVVAPYRRGITGGVLTYPDMVMHARGYLMCPEPGSRGFGRFDFLPSREYRMSRRPFMLHFRDAEIAPRRDDETRTVFLGDGAAQRIITPKEERWLYYGCLIQGMKSLMHWGYWSQFTDGFYYIKGPSMRIGLGSLDGDKAYKWDELDADGHPVEYTVEAKLAGMLRDTWDEIGRLNWEMRTVGEAIAQSDVSGWAKVTKVNPALGRDNLPAAEAVALLHGVDTIVIPVVNHNIDLGKAGEVSFLSNPNSPVSYEPVEATVELVLPPWLRNPKHVFRVSHDRLERLDIRPAGGKLVFELPRLEVSDLFVVTSSDAVLRDAEEAHATFSARIRAFEAKTAAFKEKVGL